MLSYWFKSYAILKAFTSEKLLPQALKQCGYNTEMYGKWHVGMFHEDYQPHRRGFDHFLGFLTGGADFWTHRKCYDSVGIHNNLFIDKLDFCISQSISRLRFRTRWRPRCS